MYYDRDILIYGFVIFCLTMSVWNGFKDKADGGKWYKRPLISLGLLVTFFVVVVLMGKVMMTTYEWAGMYAYGSFYRAILEALEYILSFVSLVVTLVLAISFLIVSFLHPEPTPDVEKSS